MKSSSRNVSRLWAAFSAGQRREFAAAVSGLGVRAAAKALVEYSVDEKTDLKSLQRTNTSLFEGKTLRGIPEAHDFIGAILEELTARADSTKEERILGIVDALGAHIRPHHLEKVEPLRLGPKGAARIAATVPDLPNHVEWAQAAIYFRDSNILESVMPDLTAKDRFQIWVDLPRCDSKYFVDFMLKNGVAPSTEEEKRNILTVMVQKREAAEVLEMLVEAWTEALNGFEIPTLYRDDFCFWTGRALALLLASGAKLERENWIDVFRWDLPTVIVDQISELSSSYPRVIDWDTPHAGRGFLEEVFDRLSGASAADRLSIVSTLLDVGVDPSPLTTAIWKPRLSPSEADIVSAAVKKREAKRRKLTVPQLTPMMEVDVELL